MDTHAVHFATYYRGEWEMAHSSSVLLSRARPTTTTINCFLLFLFIVRVTQCCNICRLKMTTTDDHVQSASDDLDTQQQQQRSIPVTIPSSSFAAFPPFFANPFMTPYLPQQQQQHAPALGPQPFPIDQQYTGGVDAVGNNCRINPITGGYFLAPNQYHELMQQYLQSLVHASNVVYPQESWSTSEECTTKLANLKLQQPGGQQERLLPAYLLQQMMPQTLVSADESFGSVTDYNFC
jgi:hypothetical protein